MAAGHKTRVSGFISTSSDPKSSASKPNGVSPHSVDVKSTENGVESLFDTVEFEETNGECSGLSLGGFWETPSHVRETYPTPYRRSTRFSQRVGRVCVGEGGYGKPWWWCFDLMERPSRDNRHGWRGTKTSVGSMRC